MKKVTAIIPARGGSKGIPRKNLQKINGIPLVGHSILQAQKASNINQIFVSTEDNEISKVSRQFGAETIGRPADLVNDNTFMEVDRLLIWTVQLLEEKKIHSDIIVLLYPTSPLRKIQHIEATVSKVLEEDYNSALTLTEDTSYLWITKEDGTASPTNYDPLKRGPRQKEKWNQWVENKAVYAVEKNLLMKEGCRLGGRIGWVKMDKLESTDIDNPEDLLLANAIINML